MVFIKFESGHSITIKPKQDLNNERKEAEDKSKVYLSKAKDKISYISLKRIIKTENSKARELLKEMSVNIKFMLQPIDRNFTEHIILVEGFDLNSVFERLDLIIKEISDANSGKDKKEKMKVIFSEDEAKSLYEEFIRERETMRLDVVR